jgi:murein L,D-transpeptidase YcbB/YkuD
MNDKLAQIPSLNYDVRWILMMKKICPYFTAGKMHFFCGLIFVIFLVLPGSVLHAAEEQNEINQALKMLLTRYPTDIKICKRLDIKVSQISENLFCIYSELGLKPLWVFPDGPGKKAEALFHTLRSADLEGLNPSDYGIFEINDYWNRKQPADLAQLDLLLTTGLIIYVNDCLAGHIRPSKNDTNRFITAYDDLVDPIAIITTALSAPDISSYLDELVPQHQPYRNLRGVLKRYREIAAKGGWPTIPSGKTLHPDDTADARIPIMWHLLALTGDLLPDTLQAPDEYHKNMIEAVQRFQDRHGLKADGIVGKNTLAAMNTPVEKRIWQIEINLARWRWKDRKLGEKYILVDIAGFTLQGINKGQVEIDMPVIVGKSYTKTPVFSDNIQYIDINPFWNIPPNIAQNEILSKLRVDPGYLKKNNIRLFSGWEENDPELDPYQIDWQTTTTRDISRYKLRQDPGPLNSLGTIKFVFPNTFNVYLHDTPARQLFTRTDRAFSHGCIRVANPLRLAEFILNTQKKSWNLKSISDTVASGKRTVIRLDTRLPIHIAYQTTWVDKYGNLHFSKDLYGRDALLEQAFYQNSLLQLTNKTQ